MSANADWRDRAEPFVLRVVQALTVITLGLTLTLVAVLTMGSSVTPWIIASMVLVALVAALLTRGFLPGR